MLVHHTIIGCNLQLGAEVQDLIEQWERLSSEMDKFEQNHQNYLTQLQNVEKRQKRTFSFFTFPSSNNRVNIIID